MPDISLLQQEYYGAQEEESKTPGIVSMIAFVVLVIAIGGYVTLYVYHQMLVKRTAEITENITNLKVGEVAETIAAVKELGTQAKILKELRETHTKPTQLFLSVEKATHPAVSFEDALIDVTARKLKMKGLAVSAPVLARQVEIYASDDHVAGFTVDNIGYSKKPTVSFQLTMDIKDY